MGCDIHYFVEKRKYNKWVSADKWTVDKYDGFLHVDYKDAFYSERNYNLFAVLAGVRNYINAKPIAQPRGLPPNLSKELAEEVKRWGIDGHSHSYLFLKELQDYDWTKKFMFTGLVRATEFERFLKGGTPQGWSMSVLGLPHVSNAEMIALLEENKAGKIEAVTSLTWEEKANFSSFVNKTIPRMEEVGLPDDVRAVFYFDN